MKNHFLQLAATAAILLAPAMALGEEKPAPKEKGVAADQDRPQLAKFRQTSDEWKQLYGDMLTLKSQYRSANAAQRGEIRKKWEELVAKAPALQEQLIAAAEAAYLEAPNKNEAAVNLLMTVLAERVSRDDSEAAYALGRMLLDKKCEDRRLCLLVAAAAFENGDFDEAERLLDMAEKNGSLADAIAKTQEIAACKSVVGSQGAFAACKAAWEKERKIRQAEAKADDLPRVLLKTNQGDIELELFENEAPNSTANFLALVEKGFYNGLAFHRVLPGFMAQGGDPKGDGSGGPGYSIAAEFTKPEHRLHFRGSLAMARSADPDSAGSQFYMMLRRTTRWTASTRSLAGSSRGSTFWGRYSVATPSSPTSPSPTRSSRRKCCGNAITSTR